MRYKIQISPELGIIADVGDEAGCCDALAVVEDSDLAWGEGALGGIEFEAEAEVVLGDECWLWGCTVARADGIAAWEGGWCAGGGDVGEEAGAVV